MPSLKIKRLLRKSSGFTLLEILLAMFIFTIVAMIIVGALHSVLSIQTATQSRAKKLAGLQMTFALLSRDFQQIINRPITTPNESIDAPFVGSATDVAFTHGGFANPMGTMQRSTLQRTHYSMSDGELIRETWQQLDLTPQSTSQKRTLLTGITSLEFQYLDEKNHFSTRWPSSNDQGNSLNPLPRAVKIIITLQEMGSISQLYITAGESLNKTPEPKSSDDKAKEPKSNEPEKTTEAK